MTRVVFRRWKPRNGVPGNVIALLPDVPANPGYVMSYEHVGQHGEASPGIVADTLPADPAREFDAAALLSELRLRGYDNLRVLQRLPARGRACNPVPERAAPAAPRADEADEFARAYCAGCVDN